MGLWWTVAEIFIFGGLEDLWGLHRRRRQEARWPERVKSVFVCQWTELRPAFLNQKLSPAVSSNSKEDDQPQARPKQKTWFGCRLTDWCPPEPGLFFSVSESQLVVQTNSITDAWWSCVLPSALTGQRRQMVLRAGGGPLWSLDGSDRRVTGLSEWLYSYKTAQMLAFSSLNHLLYSSNGRPSKSRKIGLIT